MTKKLSLKNVIQSFVKDAESKAISQIEKKLRHARDTASEDLDIIEIDLPPIKTKKREKVLEAIHTVFQAERIDNKLFIKRDGYGKILVHKRLVNSINTQLPSWEVLSDAIAVVNRNEFRPDVGGWNQKPTFAERFQPIINRTPPPLLWIEVAFDRGNDRDNALNKIEYLQRYCPNTEFVLIVIPYRSPFPENPNPDATSVVATASARSSLEVPYLGHWGIGVAFDAALWYTMQWNKHIVLECGPNLYFNEVLGCLQ
ncbi:1998_t:CDS:2 [Paraglomus occultum]|uniref:1998_t:CDS:1 n=1 Tax=Paraglomus occultum TaxID=144539 RepID=A0A9N8WD41_9GLOM|nr:1998_t:CDS:2 [Paraglomus occultum]